jgi:DNA ligase (NAD+)
MKSATQLHRAIQETKAPRLDRFLYGLGIRHVGQRIARVLSREYGSLDALREAGEKDLQNIPEIGPEIAHSVVSFFAQEENREVLKRLAEAGVLPKETRKKKSQALQGKTFVFTGKLEGFTREEAKRAAEDRGGRATSSVSGETDFVVQGDNPGSKLEEARRQKVKVISEQEFVKLMEGT